MSKWYTQVTYECKCEEGYGSQCGKKSRFVLKHNVSVDRTTIYHKRHIGDEGSVYRVYVMPEYMSDEEIGGLQRLLMAEPYVTGGEEIDKDFLADKIEI